MEISELHKLFLVSDGICTDTRNLVPNTLFFALKGDNFNGNKFANEALAAGCNYSIVDEVEFSKGDKCILVESVLKTIQDLANYHRRRFDIPVLGITGSNGKTTTKELIGAVLEKKYNLLITTGNFNNQLGVPFTLLKLTKNHDFAVIEMGANKPGDIQELVQIAEPTHGIITNIGAAHIEGFGSLEGVIKTKTELYNYIASENGFLFYNAEDEVLMNEMPLTQNASYGESKGDVKGSLESLDPFVNFKWSEEGFQSGIINSKLVGRYNLSNFLAAVTIGRHFKVETNDIGLALSSYVPSNNRSQVTKTDRNTLIVDCYNANATSMKAALDSFSEMSGENKLAVLGDMLELGEISEVEHQKIADQVKSLGVDVYLVGAEFSKVNSDFEKFATVQDLLEKVDVNSLSNKLILLKGSRGIKLETLITDL
ncbi:MAG: UDP-N-acetylmuramoyl-tripeptide--D-alanyl-D-alanine ligase [Arenicella sp.]|jgi:UDP-N-acetylmuramoyl-tripeptide--D-alanyl-D-alanine ligase